VSLPKGTEVLSSYNLNMAGRAARRESLKCYGFECNCELCALPDDLSNALDVKIKLANDAAAYLYRFYELEEDDPYRAVQLLDVFMSITIRERLVFKYNQFFLPLKIFGLLAKPRLVQQVGDAILRVFYRHLGDTGLGDGNASVENMTATLERVRDQLVIPQSESLASMGLHDLDAQLEKAASSIVSYLKSVP
jgi:hypothetical protein